MLLKAGNTDKYNQEHINTMIKQLKERSSHKKRIREMSSE